ncbi:MAG: hypothetical protein AB7J35_21165 [Dehalococcoidia bacterium]
MEPGFVLASTWRAVNLAAESAGSIHDDKTAAALGFNGGFVGGVTILGQVHETWRSLDHAPHTPARVEFKLESPTYQDESVSIYGRSGQREWEFVVLGEDGRKTSSGVIGAPNAWGPEGDVCEIPELQPLFDESVIQHLTFSSGDVSAYRARAALSGEDARKSGNAVPMGMWSNPMKPVISILGQTTDLLTIHRSCVIEITAELEPDERYTMETSIKEARWNPSAGRGFVRVAATYTSDDSSGPPAVRIEHKSAIRARHA